jgi:hypothetical protein
MCKRIVMMKAEAGLYVFPHIREFVHDSADDVSATSRSPGEFDLNDSSLLDPKYHQLIV